MLELLDASLVVAEQELRRGQEVLVVLLVLDLRVRGVELVRRCGEQERAHALAVVRLRLEQLLRQCLRPTLCLYLRRSTALFLSDRLVAPVAGLLDRLDAQLKTIHLLYHFRMIPRHRTELRPSPTHSPFSPTPPHVLPRAVPLRHAPASPNAATRPMKMLAVSPTPPRVPLPSVHVHKSYSRRDSRMTRYHYETLGDDGFQKLAQALITFQHPQAQCFPLGQSDGGRDAVAPQSTSQDRPFIVFQVKYSNDPSHKDARALVQSVIASEKTKVDHLIARGAKEYYLITNVKGTGRLDAGSIDRAQNLLTDTFGIPAQVWWRDDIDARLDSAPAIKWSYLQILNAADILALLLRSDSDPVDQQSGRTIRAYLGTQYDRDRDVKFKQVELQQTLTDVFVDLPIAEKCFHDEPNRRQRISRPGVSPEINAYLDQLDPRYGGADVPAPSLSDLAATFFLQMPLTTGVTRFVLEGAPGQGKSTVTQFICQSHRLRLLNRDAEQLQRLQPHHKAGPLRAPFRIDLRDYAAWLNGRHPFAKKGEAPVPEDGPRSLESFIAMQTRWDAGNLAMTQDQLLHLERSQAVIVLDGFDEVADIPTSFSMGTRLPTRTRLVEEISSASVRLDTNVRSLHVIVTSRPAAFANSPGFPENEWIHLELRDLRDDNIRAYTNKWIASQRLDAKQASAVSTTLEDKLEQPHMRDLARNPMQLAILLHLIHVQGVALPEKRTTLYDEYMKIYFNREAEKSPIVRDRRDLILSIHGMLAWILQTQAEDGSGSGSVTMDDLRLHIRHFLEAEEHDVALADALLAGTFERVGALVSRVQGTYEFEVQPLREYFAARHLYKTSPYSPPGRARTGTRPERFDALARNAYWTNVTRFFCGFYDIGELGTLVDGFLQLSEERDYTLINKTRQLALMLLGDHVFSQSPREMKRLVGFIAEEPGFDRYVASMAMPPRWRDMRLPENAGQQFLYEACAEKFGEETESQRRRVLGRIMRANTHWSTMKDIWKRRHPGPATLEDLREAMAFGIVEHFDVSEIEACTKHDVDLRCRWFLWANLLEDIANDRELYASARVAFFDEALFFPSRSSDQAEAVVALETLTKLLNVEFFVNLVSDEWPDGTTVYSSGWMPKPQRQHEQLRRLDSDGHSDDAGALVRFAVFVIEHLDREVLEWQTTLAPWSALTDRGFEIAGESALVEQIAMISTVVPGEAHVGVWQTGGFRRTKGLARRLQYARSKGGDQAWWRRELRLVDEAQIVLCIAILLLWGESDVLLALGREVNERVSRLTPTEWERLWSLLSRGRRAAGEQCPTIDTGWLDGMGEVDPRMVLAIIDGVGHQHERRRLSRRMFAGYEGMEHSILWCAANYENVDGKWSDVDWEFMSQISVCARRAGMVSFLGVRADGSHSVDVPEGLAARVLQKCDRHCAQFVLLCEQAYSMAVARRAPKVATIAERDNWFAPHSA